MSFLTHFSKRLGQITMEGVAFEKVDITLDGEARDYVMSLGYLQAPVVVAGDEHWSGFRPDRIKALSKSVAAASDAAALPA
ncbi:glutaredoxin [Mycolicibacterium conceptionense]|jgi:glutaredoxin-like protein NrdH|uniref:Glutaredoxin n=2 Tax=Mycolicibacterium TaxID=1866885 RepID=A0A0J8TXJ0_9MYCO|nr:glutaredoxin domain-containing protein [Mycolicibacterium conceptionense]KLI04139.1 glutaredoxin [Mycolicibacterium senegalense]KLO51391.1 glutaredoxin [Mycolicibacterium senegalense]KMV14098.1 glutaredoxin [Mycolicibacterium conceptionense]OBK08712.1 NrdH-redoxin [Mycolicibacterium conceptionense]OMB79206.1 NrdH-redoxin [Mycolicibacterium conceptionense]